MKAAVLASAGGVTKRLLRIEDVPKPEPAAGQVLLRVRACGVCRTDLHIVEGELRPLREILIPGHQIVGEIIQGATPELALGTRVGVSWIGARTAHAGIARITMRIFAIRRPSPAMR
jgi:propanol-preferring alcohol dehydrogenase